MAALYDRFLIRGFVDRVQDRQFGLQDTSTAKNVPQGFKDLLNAGSVDDDELDTEAMLYTQEIMAVRELVRRSDKKVSVPEQVLCFLNDLRIFLDGLVLPGGSHEAVGERLV